MIATHTDKKRQSLHFVMVEAAKPSNTLISFPFLHKTPTLGGCQLGLNPFENLINNFGFISDGR